MNIHPGVWAASKRQNLNMHIPETLLGLHSKGIPRGSSLLGVFSYEHPEQKESVGGSVAGISTQSIRFNPHKNIVR